MLTKEEESVMSRLLDRLEAACSSDTDDDERRLSTEEYSARVNYAREAVEDFVRGIARWR